MSHYELLHIDTPMKLLQDSYFMRSGSGVMAFVDFEAEVKYLFSALQHQEFSGQVPRRHTSLAVGQRSLNVFRNERHLCPSSGPAFTRQMLLQEG